PRRDLERRRPALPAVVLLGGDLAQHLAGRGDRRDRADGDGDADEREQDADLVDPQLVPRLEDGADDPGHAASPARGAEPCEATSGRATCSAWSSPASSAGAATPSAPG